jgi:sporulation protein YlmC with PRC-barrel domain
MSGKLSKGTTVVSLESGATLGKVDHVYLDPATKELVAFSFATGSLLSGKVSHLVDIADVHAIGPDAVTLGDTSAIHDLLAVEGKCDELVDLDTLIKRNVITEGGEALGQVAGLDFEADSYRLVRLHVSPGLLKENSVIPGHAIRNIGDEMIVVADDVCAQERPAEPRVVAAPTRLRAETPEPVVRRVS